MKTVRFSGDFEYVCYEWRPLPDDKEELARNNPYLEIRKVDEVAQAVAEVLVEGTADDFLKQDDLTRIRGIGKATEAVLSLYYPTFEALANADQDDLAELLARENLKARADDLIAKARELL